MIVGVGVDLTPISRMAAVLGRHADRFAEKIFTPGERRDCDASAEPAQHYAARFAAKEAAVKACPALRGQKWHEVEVVREPDGRPRLVVHGAAAAVSSRMGIARFHVSLTHAGDSAVAMVVAEGP